MKKLYFLNEEEKNRILSIHESATKRHYLGEQAASSEWLPDPTKNPNWEYQFKDNKWFARKKNNPTQEYDISKDTKYASSIKKLNDAYPKGVMSSVKTDTNTDPNKTVQDTTKKIQALLGLEQTGNMDSNLLQKINEKLNGKPQEAPKADVTTQPKVEPLQQLTPAGSKTPQLTTMTPEQLTASLQQKTAGVK